MTKEEMKAIRLDMRFSLRDLAAVTGIPYRTLQDYEGGQRAIPEHVAERLKAEQGKEQKIKSEVYASIESAIDREHSNGLYS